MKTFKQMFDEEMAGTSTANVVGTGSDVADWKTTKKKKRRTITKHFIEVNGKIKRQVK
jgi:uncharacterized protein HemX